MMHFVEVTVGFNPEDYSVREIDGEVILIIELLDGVLERNVTVEFETRSVTATEEG